MPAIRRTEERILRRSLFADVFYAALTLGLGFFVGSQTILFDGLFSLISAVLSGATLAAFKFMNEADWQRFPYGKSTIEPLIVIVRYLALLALVLGSVIAAVITIARGGREVMVDVGLAYSLFAVAACFGMAFYLRRANRSINSAFIRSDLSEWRLDGFVSIGVVAGFAIAWIMQRVPSMAAYVRYVDPVMMLLFSVVFLRGPIREIRASLREVLEMRPAGRLADEVESVVREIGRSQQVQETFVRVTKVSRTLWVEIDYVVGSTTRLQSIDEQDALRERIVQALPHRDYQIWLTLCLTNDRKWAV